MHLRSVYNVVKPSKTTTGALLVVVCCCHVLIYSEKLVLHLSCQIMLEVYNYAVHQPIHQGVQREQIWNVEYSVTALWLQSADF